MQFGILMFIMGGVGEFFFFEGWYYKIVSKNQTNASAIILGIEVAGQHKLLVK